VSGVASGAGAVRHAAHLSQTQRSNIASPDSGDQSSPFETLLDAGDAPPVPNPAASGPAPAPQRFAARPQDGAGQQPSAPANTDDPASTSPAGAGAGNQAASDSGAPSTAPKGPDIIDSALAALAGRAQSGNTGEPGADPQDATANGNGADASTASDPSGSSTADAGGDPTIKPDSKRDTKSGAKTDGNTSELDVANNQQPNAPAAPVAAVLSLSFVTSVPTVTDTSGDQDAGVDGSSGAGSTTGEMAALSDAIRAAATRGRGDRAGADTASSSSAADGSAKGGKGTDATAAVPANSTAGGTSQPDGGDGTQGRNPGAVSATAAAADHARQLAAIGQPANATAATQADASAGSNSAAATDQDSDRDASASPPRIEDIGRQVFQAALRRIDVPTDGGGAQTDTGAAATTTPLPGSASGAAAPVLTASAGTSSQTNGASPATVPIAGLAVEIASRFSAGSSRFEIRLDPPELGRINVRLDVDRDGKVTSRVVADRPETLDILQRSAPELERSLQQSGLKTADNGLQFSLRDQGGFNAFNGQNPYPNNGSPAGTTRLVVSDRDMASIEGIASYGRAAGARAGIDIRV
jgi:flagellar hook-length control protein FliK